MTQSTTRFLQPVRALALLTALMLCCPCVRAQTPYALLVGGGPSQEHNQFAIESNVRYVLRLLPQNARHTILYASGDPKEKNVLYESEATPMKPGERLLA